MSTVTIAIERFDGKNRRVQEYALDSSDLHNKTVLNVLIFIREKMDPTLNFTASCRSAICGACGVRVNGLAILACDTMIEDQLAVYKTDRLTIAPLNNFKVISDLVVDWEPSIDNLRKVRPELVAKDEFSREKGCRQSPAAFEDIKGMWDCILCGCCASECEKLTSSAKDYMHPFVYTHATRAAVDSRSKDPMIHARPAHDNGLWKCVHCQQCASVCPKGIRSSDNIARLRALTMRKGLTQGKGPDHAQAFLTDLKDTGRLNEMKLALRTEGVAVMGRVGMAVDLLKRGKVHPAELLGDEKIQGHAEFMRMLDAAKASKSEE